MRDALAGIVASQERHATGGADCLGNLIWWSLNGNRITHEDLEQAAARHGLPEKYLPAPVKPAGAFRRAWRHAAQKTGDGLMLRQIDDNPDSIIIGAVRETPDTVVERLDYDQLATITFDKRSGAVSSRSDLAVVEEVRALYVHHLAHTTPDIRTLLVNFVSEAGVSLRESGGVYWIPAGFTDTVRAMGEVLAGIGANKLHRLPLYDSPDARDTLNQVTVTTLDEEIRRLQAELEVFLGDEKTRRSTLERRLESFDALQQRVETFAGVLSFKSSDLLEKLGTGRADLRRHLGLEEADAEEPVPDEGPAVVEEEPGPEPVVHDSPTFVPDPAIGF